VLVLAAGGAAGWKLTRHHRPPALAARSTAPRRSGSSPAAGTLPAAASSSPPPFIQVSAAAAASPAAGPVQDVLASYFTAINQHDYQQYASLLTPALQQGVTPASFASGYGSTTDSGMTLTSIASADSGSVAASVTFTSQQDPAASPDGSACDDWQITLYLQPDGGSYQIGSPPSGYHAAYAPCA
jgi:hypothetical protein